MTCRSVSVMLAMLLVGRTAAAQVTYTVFSRTPESGAVVGEQPTGRDARVSVTVHDSTVKYVIKTLVHQANLHIVYNVDEPTLDKRVSIQITNASIFDALSVALKGTGLMAKMAPTGETVLIVKAANSQDTRSHIPPDTVLGKVTDSASGKGVSGASVTVQGTKLSTVTDDQGGFVLHGVPIGTQLVTVKLFGYKPAARTITIAEHERVRLHFVLTPTATVLSGVVTTATGMQQKITVGNDITTINVDSVMKVAPIMSVTDLLETRVPGLTVLHTSGTPGDPSRIRLRGASSLLGNNDPIVIVDGVRVYAAQSDARNMNLAASKAGGAGSGIVRGSPLAPSYAAPSPLDQIDPNSIETIEVFKGPSASALYGSDAANGVIVITTKHGRAGPTRWHVDMGAGFNSEPGDWPVNYYRFGYGPSSGTGSPFCDWNDLNCTVDSVVAYQALNDSRYSVFADHGSNQNISASVSGGVSLLQYSLTGTATNNDGILKLPGLEQQRYQEYYSRPAPYWMVRPDNYKTYSGTGQLTVQPNQKSRITIMSQLSHRAQRRTSLGGAISQLEGAYINPLLLGTSPLIKNEMELATDAQLASTNSVTLSWQPVPWLPITTTTGLNTIQRNDKIYIPFGVNSGGIAVASDTDGYYSLGRGTSEERSLNLGTQMTLPHMLLSVGGNYNAQSTADIRATTKRLGPGITEPTQFPNTPTAGGGVVSDFSQNSLTMTTYGWYVAPKLHLHSRFFVSPGFRLDGGSASGTHANLAGLPKIDLSYVAVDRSDNPLWGFLSLLRPRVAFGVAGTQPGPAQRLRLYNENDITPAIYLDGAIVPATFLTSLGNTQLQPETSRELEGGLDAALWNDRLQITYSQYNKTRRNAIIQIPVASSVDGGGSIYFNIGAVRNTGTELTVNATVFENRAVSWNVAANLSNDDNVLVRLNSGAGGALGQSSNGGAGTVIRNVPGYPLFGVWTKPIVSYIDVNKDGIIEANEIRYGDSLVYVGQPDPKYQANFSTNVSLLNGRLGVHATLAYQSGLTQFNYAGLNSGAFQSLGNAPGISFATQAAIEAVAPYPSTPQSAIGLVQTINTLRFQSFSVNYTLPSATAAFFRVHSMSVSILGSNLGLHTNYRGKDPDVNALASGNGIADLGQLPEPRTWLLRITIE